MTILTKLIKRKINPTVWQKDNNKLKAIEDFHPYSSGSRNSAQVGGRGGGNKHEIYLATFNGLFSWPFLIGATWPWPLAPPRMCYFPSQTHIWNGSLQDQLPAQRFNVWLMELTHY